MSDTKFENKGDEPPPYGWQGSPPPPPPPLQAFRLLQPGQNQRDAENGGVPDSSGGWGDFSIKETRIKFIRKVYGIITVQLLFTFGIVCVFVFAEPVKAFAQSPAGFGCYIASYIVFFILVIAISCCGKQVGIRKFPLNFILLGLVTICMTYMLGMISSYHRTSSVLIAIGITFFVTVGVTIFAIQTKYDFTNCWMLMLFLSLAFLGFGIAVGIASAFGSNYILQAVYGGIGAILMALFLAIDTQMLVGGKRRAIQFSQEDYIYAALQIYLDICYIFLYILTALGGSNK